MSSSLRPVSIVNETGGSIRANHVVGVDESGNDASAGGICVTAAVRTRRRNDPRLVRALIDHDLRPFEHKSSTLVRYEDTTKSERARNVASFLDALDDTPITWSAVVCEGSFSQHERATATSMAAKKAVTNAIGHMVRPEEDEHATLLHDGKIDCYGTYEQRLREQVVDDFDRSFRRGVCPVHLTFLQDADRTYPQSNAADYIAGYLRSELMAGRTAAAFGSENVHRFDPSWMREVGEVASVYRLADLEPIREKNRRSRALSWILGKGIPLDPTPTTRDPFRELVAEIPDERVRDYLLTEL